MFINAELRSIFRNFFSLNLVQMSNIIFPLIILPYVVRVLGVGKFGLISFVQSFMMYFVFLSDYGFSFAGTREVSLCKNDREKLSEVFYSILILKFILGIICLMMVLILINSFKFFGNNGILYLISTGILFGSIFFPQWFFQGMEKMGFIPVINISVKLVQFALIFLLIKRESDSTLYLLIISGAQLATGLTGFIISLNLLKYRLFLPGVRSLRYFLKKAFSFFSASLGLNIFNNSNTFIIGIMAGDYAAGIFSAADKIRLSLQGIISSFIVSVFPHAVYKARDSRAEFILFYHKTLAVSLVIGILIGIILYIFAEKAVAMLLGPAFSGSILLLKLFSIVIIIFSAGEIFSYIVLLPFQYEKLFNKIVWTGTILHIIFLLILVHFYKGTGAVFSVIATQLILTAGAAAAVFRKRLVQM